MKPFNGTANPSDAQIPHTGRLVQAPGQASPAYLSVYGWAARARGPLAIFILDATDVEQPCSNPMGILGNGFWMRY